MVVSDALTSQDDNEEDGSGGGQQALAGQRPTRR